jgi:hypothetical protein
MCQVRPDSCRRSVVAHDVRSPSVVPHRGKDLAPWVMPAASPLYKGVTVAVVGPPSLPPKSTAFNPSKHFWLRYVSKFSVV